MHPIYSRYKRPGELELDEAFFPIMWREDGYRTLRRVIDQVDSRHWSEELVMPCPDR